MEGSAAAMFALTGSRWFFAGSTPLQQVQRWDPPRQDQAIPVVMAMDRASLVAVLMTLIVTGITLGLYQLNFQGFTHLTNYSKVPEYDLTGTRLYENGTLLLQVARVAGPDTYGGFIVEVQLLYPNGTTLYSWNSRLLGDIPSADIKNAIPLHPTKSDG